MDKKDFRRQIKEKRITLSADYKEDAGSLISQAVLSLDEYKNASTVFIYISDPNEPDTKAITEDALKNGKSVFVPKCIKKGIMLPVRLREDTVLKSGFMGIKEPESEEYADSQSFDISIIPCMSCDKNKNRLGHGGGYYDIFLSEHNSFTVCLCFDKMMSDILPGEAHDITPHIVITEKEIIR